MLFYPPNHQNELFPVWFFFFNETTWGNIGIQKRTQEPKQRKKGKNEWGDNSSDT